MIETQRQPTAPKQAGPKPGQVASALRKAADGTSRRAHSAWTRLMPAPGYRPSGRTGISDLLISATSERRQPTPITQICAGGYAATLRSARRTTDLARVLLRKSHRE